MPWDSDRFLRADAQGPDVSGRPVGDAWSMRVTLERAGASQRTGGAELDIKNLTQEQAEKMKELKTPEEILAFV